MGASMGANSADLRTLARAILDRNREAQRGGGTDAPQVSHAASMRGTAKSLQIQRCNHTVPPSHTLGAGTVGHPGNEPNPARGTPTWDTDGTVGNPYATVLAALRKGCPKMVDAADWQQALSDAETFVLRWATQAHALGWTPRELFGLHLVPQNPGPTYRRLSRYDETGLIWLLRSCPVIALSESAAEIQGKTGAVTRYRKHHKPALGPLGDSLVDLGAAIAESAPVAASVPIMIVIGSDPDERGRRPTCERRV
jgi:hypothetical protein